MSERTSEHPERIWIMTYGSDTTLFDEWDDERMYSTDVEYIRADIHEKRIAELEAAVNKLQTWLLSDDVHSHLSNAYPHDYYRIVAELDEVSGDE